MKTCSCLFALILLTSCQSQSDNTQMLERRIDSLEAKLSETYKPGLGEFMSSIQVHHNKLWFAGINQNWKLADFEIHEIMESLDDIRKFQTERKESQMVQIINPALDSVSAAIRQRNLPAFRSSYTLLTRTCNNCHQEAGFEFNRVQIPEYPPYSNQDFEHPAE